MSALPALGSASSPSVLSRVTPALWTTTSTPPCAAKRVADRRRRVLGGDVERDRRAADRAPSPRARSSASAGHVEPDDVGAVARERPGDRRADPARGAGDERDLAVAAGAPSRSSGTARPAPIAHDLARDVGRARREQEAQRRAELVLGAGRDVDELGGRAAARPPCRASATKPSSARCAVACARASAQSPAACRARPRRPRRLRARRIVGWKNAHSSTQLGRVGDPGGVEDERLQALLAGASGSRPRRRRRPPSARGPGRRARRRCALARRAPRRRAGEPRRRAPRRPAPGRRSPARPACGARARPAAAARRAGDEAARPGC